MTWSVVLVSVVVLATFAIGLYGVRLARTTSDFFVATRAVGPMWNASAIAGEYLSAASFLGIAGLLLKQGGSALWYPLGYAAGYLVLLLFVAAPLRRFGAYTIPDFAAGRFSSLRLRLEAAVLVLVIGWFYLLPQMKGAGVTFSLLTGAPYWAGVVLVGVLVTVAVSMGGMKGVTYVQAFHYWTKLVAIAVPAGILLALMGLSDGERTAFADGLPVFPEATEVTFGDTTTLEVREAVDLVMDGTAARWDPGVQIVEAGSVVEFPAGAAVPAPADVTVDGMSWTLPFPESSVHSLVAAMSVLTATVFGTMGLPHILVRFYTNRDGTSARRTAVGTLALVAMFYFFPWVYAALGRLWVPSLYVTGETEVVVLAVPRILGGGAGSFLGGLVAAGAFSAFLSTSSGLLVSVAGALSHDLAAPIQRRAPDATRLNMFRLASVLAGAVAMGLGMLVRPFEINVLVGWAFAIAASAFCPLLVLGIWWPRLTSKGAAAGMAFGGGVSTAAIVITMVEPQGGWLGVFLTQPAIVTVPAAFLVMIVVSVRTRVPRGVEHVMLWMHSPDLTPVPPFPPAVRRRPFTARRGG
jgi:Na+(H+)/acetate symporter ActP